MLQAFNEVCPILILSGHPCPTCGITRSVFYVLKFDFSRYFLYNPFAVPVIFAAFAAIHRDKFKFFKSKWVNIYIIITAFAAFIFYIYRMVTNSFPF